MPSIFSAFCLVMRSPGATSARAEATEERNSAAERSRIERRALRLGVMNKNLPTGGLSFASAEARHLILRRRRNEERRTVTARTGHLPSVRSASTVGADFHGADGTHRPLARPLRDLRISVTDRCNFRCPTACRPRSSATSTSSSQRTRSSRSRRSPAGAGVRSARRAQGANHRRRTLAPA